MPKGSNWLLAIGAPFDPVPDSRTCLELLESKFSGEWGSKSARGDNANYYKQLSEHYAEIKEALADSAHVAEFAREAATVVYGELDGALKTASDEDGTIASGREQIAKFVNKQVRKKTGVIDYSLDEALVERRAQHLGLSWDKPAAETDQKAVDAYEKYCKTRLPEERSYNSADKDLPLFDAATLYDFAQPEGVGDPRRASNADLVAAAQALKARQRRNTAEDAAASSLEALCRKAFASDESRKGYDAYLRRKALKEALQEFADIAGLSNKTLSVASQREAIERLALLVDTKADARPLLVGYCQEKGIALERDAEISSKTVCRCGHVNEKGAAVCSRCGLPLVVECPGCHTKSPNTEDRCPKCGTPLGLALDEASSLCEQARRQATRLDFAGARQCLEEASRSWPALPTLAGTRREVERLEGVAGPLAKELASSLAESRFVAARDALRRAQSMPGFDGVHLAGQERRVSRYVEEADEVVRRAGASADPEDAAELCAQALALCADHPSALSFLAAHPPLPASSVRAVADQSKGSVHVSWQRSRSKGALVYEVLLQEEGGLGERSLGTTKSTTFVHESAPVGRPCHYRVVTHRGEVSSRPSPGSAPVVVAPGVEGLRAVPSHGRVELSWRPLPESAHVRVSEASGAVPPRELHGPHSCVLEGLSDGVTYTFVVDVAYRVSGAAEARGASARCSATPLDVTTYPTHLHARSTGEGSYELTWEGTGAPVRFFAAERREDVPAEGSALTLDELERDFEILPVDSRSDGLGTLSWRDERSVHAFVVGVYGGSAVVGARARIATGGAVKIREASVLNGALSIDVDCKDPGVNGFMVLVSESRFVDDLESDEPGVLRKLVPVKQWRRDGRLTVPGAKGDHLCVTVFARSGAPGDFVFSDPAQVEVNQTPRGKIVYTFSVSRPLIGRPSATFTFRSAEGSAVFTLPEVRIACCVGRVPHMAPDAATLATFGPVEARGSYSYTVELPKQKNLNVEAYPASGPTPSFMSSCGYRA